jgi:hypothetical protein
MPRQRPGHTLQQEIDDLREQAMLLPPARRYALIIWLSDGAGDEAVGRHPCRIPRLQCGIANRALKTVHLPRWRHECRWTRTASLASESEESARTILTALWEKHATAVQGPKIFSPLPLKPKSVFFIFQSPSRGGLMALSAMIC